MKKTNAQRMLSSKKINFETFHYSADDGKIDGISVAEKIGQPIALVYKTLALRGVKGIYIALVPVSREIDLKVAALAFHEKSVELIPVKDLLKLTGYERGGCSPIGMKKLFPTYIDSSVVSLSDIIVSGGAIGTQIKLSVDTLIHETAAIVTSLVH